MAQRKPAPLWLNLEYLSAEDWTLGCHGLPSPHPRLPLRQYFYFPGFDPRSGGLLREHDLIARRDAFQCDTEAQAAFWRELGCADAMQAGKRLSLFAYENPAVPDLLRELADDPAPGRFCWRCRKAGCSAGLANGAAKTCGRATAARAAR